LPLRIAPNVDRKLFREALRRGGNYPETGGDRRRLEEKMLRRYHEVLKAHGVSTYSWRELNDDYRLSVLTCLTVATEWCRGRPNANTKHIWMPMLRKVLVAVDDLNCRELL
jgi:hypothetical protein